MEPFPDLLRSSTEVLEAVKGRDEGAYAHARVGNTCTIAYPSRICNNIVRTGRT
jgi:hypothetical protein